MTTSELSVRVAALEAEMARIKEQLREGPGSKKDIVDVWYGKFANDPYFDEAMRLGRKYRESLRPRFSKPARKLRKAAKSAKNRTRLNIH